MVTWRLDLEAFPGCWHRRLEAWPADVVSLSTIVVMIREKQTGFGMSSLGGVIGCDGCSIAITRLEAPVHLWAEAVRVSRQRQASFYKH